MDEKMKRLLNGIERMEHGPDGSMDRLQQFEQTERPVPEDFAEDCGAVIHTSVEERLITVTITGERILIPGFDSRVKKILMQEDVLIKIRSGDGGNVCLELLITISDLHAGQ